MEEYAINAFSAGELTPKAAGRSDVPSYKNGARTILNGIVFPQGGVTRKPGSFMLTNLETSSGFIEFKGTDGIGYLLVFSDLLFKVFILGVEHTSTDIVTLYPTAEIPNIQYAIDGNTMYLVNGAREPYVITYVPSTGVFSILVYSTTAIAAGWDLPDHFETTGNFPYCVTFYEGRLLFGNTDNFPNYIWGSNVKLYTTFDETDPANIVSTDGFEVVVNSKRGPKVLWLNGQRGLFVGTSSGVFSISDENSLLSPVSLISAKQNSSYPATTIPGFTIGGELFYVQAGERKIRLAVFDRDKDIYNTPDITSAAEHITEGKILKVVVQMLPETLIWVLLENGTLLTFSYNKENQINAWTKLSTTGTYKDIAVIREGDTETVYVIADRDDTEYLEKMNPIDFSSNDYMYLDSALTVTFGDEFTILNIETVAGRVYVTTAAHGYGGTEYVGVDGTGIVGIDKVTFKIEVFDATHFWLLDEILESDLTVDVTPAVTIGTVQEADNVIPGLTHLEGNDVRIMSGPVNVGSGTVDTGSVTVVTRRTEFTVGLNFVTDIVPMNIGLAKNRKKNIKHISAELYKTIAPKGGMDEDNIDYFRYKRNIVMNDPEDMYTGLSEIPFRGGTDYAGEILIRQDLPLPMTVLSITVEMEVY
jgi:hypothetical protein